MKSWLSECELYHPLCKPAQGQTPKRLIDVGVRDGRPARLVLSQCLDTQQVRYATLSYCWGDSNFVTTKDNVDAYSQDIPFDLLRLLIRMPSQLLVHSRFPTYGLMPFV